ncbi:hypothetical protein N7519_003933 [Penicillium mononematosum]|uniref:uncharacterized protein n=1 Tax=Penicillium mononematosum TaxID=268346 RepID=UPI002549A79B|nr:uncharacterized protein N7519_003933 [Penicillium mononematosum]KAJ6189025.1 hypothetical protein N7519_003933 [Penicillium mononematosum]
MDDTVPRADSVAHEEKAEESGNSRPQVHFSVLSALGVQFSVTGAPLTLGTYLSLTIGVGGSPAYFWGFILVGFFQVVIGLAVSELASAIPHSSGPAHWVVALAPPQYRRGLGYTMGWLLNCAWLCITSASCLYPAQLTLALVQANHPDFIPASYHVYLLYMFFSLVFLSVNLPIALKSLGYILSAAVFLFNGSAIYCLITLLIRATPKQSAQVVFIEFVNETGWDSDGWVFFVGLLPAAAVLGALDSATHLTDELENPSRQVPLVLLGSLGLSITVGIPMILVYQFCNIDPISMLEPVGGQPLVQLLLNATSSLPLTNVGISLIIFCFCLAGASALVSWSRLYWSFSREGALPFSGTMSKLTSRHGVPLNALLWNTLLCVALGTVSIGSTTAMNALFGASGLCSTTSLIVAMGLALWNGRDRLDNRRWLNLGRWGNAIFWVALVWSVLMCVAISMPLYLPVTPTTMNWASVVFLGFVFISGVYWVCVFSRMKHPQSTNIVTLEDTGKARGDSANAHFY